MKGWVKKAFKKVLKNLPVIKQINGRHWDLKNKLEENNNILKGIQQQGNNVLESILQQSYNVLENMQRQNDTVLENMQRQSDTVLESIRQFERKFDSSIQRINSYSTMYMHHLIKHIHEIKTIQEINTKAFAKYRSVYKDRDIVIIGTGPTLKYYNPINDCITIGTNGAVNYDKIKLDYLFVQDINAFNKHEDRIIEYDCKKFFSFWGNFHWNLPSKYRSIQNIEEYCTYPVGHFDSTGYIFTNEGFIYHSIPLDICNSPMADFQSVIFPAIQFALWTYPKRIYIVGCDCSVSKSNDGIHFNDTEVNETIVPVDDLLIGWNLIKKFQQISYPDVEIISINPVYLKGLFKDEYTQSYLEAHPEMG
jgi:hypothetical protein